MAPHLIAKELDILMQAVGKQWPPKEIRRAICMFSPGQGGKAGGAAQ